MCVNICIEVFFGWVSVLVFSYALFYHFNLLFSKSFLVHVYQHVMYGIFLVIFRVICFKVFFLVIFCLSPVKNTFLWRCYPSSSTSAAIIWVLRRNRIFINSLIFSHILNFFNLSSALFFFLSLALFLFHYLSL